MFPSYVSRSCNNRVSNPILEFCNKGIYSLYGALSYFPALFPQEPSYIFIFACMCSSMSSATDIFFRDLARPCSDTLGFMTLLCQVSSFKIQYEPDEQTGTED
uniref:Uncharacterized protein n=1 Tax=Salix viminalis TaxID=40686 RepID=A0A6N2M823_SALVM